MEAPQTPAEASTGNTSFEADFGSLGGASDPSSGSDGDSGSSSDGGSTD